MRCFASATAFLPVFGFEKVCSSSFGLIYLMNSFASVRAGERQHWHTRSAPPQRRSRRDFKEQCLPNGGGKVVGGRSQWHFNTFRLFLQAENQMIVTRDRTS
jgi:hypothetical protein